ncbi:uncharacterized protein LOC135705513 [Ochlerotatus camptorhynchus]|uniref:uncharacterized protein LOC135705513 n=1 Tax=Ochlerotatus camptorhynchus TaxID=644619 RepID=UPI0031E05904
MDKLELEIRKEIDELNTSVSLIDRLDSSDTMDDEKQEQLLSSTRAVFDNVNSSHAKNSLTDSQISIISKHDGYPDSGHFYATPLTPTSDDSSGDCCDKRGTTTSMSDGDKTLMTDSSRMMRVASDTSSKDTKVDSSTSCTDSSKCKMKQKKDSKSDKKAASATAAAAKHKKAAAAAAAAAGIKLPGADQYSPNGGNSSLVSFLFPPGSPHLKKKSLPSMVVLGVLQLLFSVTLAALGGLVLARNASLAMAGTGLWCGAISGIAGSLGLMNVKMAKTGFLAVNLICVASSTLGLALTGIGAVRDANLAQQDESVWFAVTAGSGLLTALALHFLVSVFSVYYSALKLCSRPSQKSQLIENVINSSSHGSQAFMSQQKVEDYINSLQVDPSIKDMMYQTMLKRGYGSVYGEKHRSDTFSNGTGAGSRPVMLVPACAGNGLQQMMQMYPSSPPPPGSGGPPMMFPSNLMPPGVPQYPPMYPDTAMLEAHIARVNRKRSVRSSSEQEQQPPEEVDERHRHRHHRSEGHQNQEKTFTYTGLDRDIADSYLAKEEEKLNSSSIVSTATAGGGGAVATLNRPGKEGGDRANSPPLTYHHDLMLIDHRHHFERYQDVQM